MHLQVLLMTDNEKELLSNHLAHDLKTFNTFYKVQEAALSLAKVSRLLLAAEKGCLSQFKGRSVEEIDLEGSISVFHFN